MSLLNDNIEKPLHQAFKALTGPVKIVMFIQGENALECEYCLETRQLLEEVSALSDKITLDVYDFVHDGQLAERYHIDKIPAVAILSGGATAKDYGIRLYGVPAVQDPPDGHSQDPIVRAAAFRPEMSTVPQGQVRLRWTVESGLPAVRPCGVSRRLHYQITPATRAAKRSASP